MVSLAGLLGSASCHTPTEPVLDGDLTGDWLGSAARGPCGQGWGEDWTSVEMSLVQTGTAVSGEVFAPGGRHFSISSTDGVFLTVGGLEGSSTCEAFGFFIADRRYDAAGALVAFSGTLGGRCCGTVAGAFALRRR